ncbi:NAD(P)-dependent alcohol dehydrogenase [Mucilaginibacter terrenus]|uniref:NAD(P)-dependent alcohol dehydrogenase n=1 Tax=Mucilaginibacter terrenus TaxID=2482727 RepID=A0A3E2NW32_9SPHI|nr:NAD(P)-dependent alcohol dehydrogenase [Mucilaginibacter terrenus]RFZ85121.1 NAD(P)-dependent alcohol dehydrogenase [Mucilaginibacter terrenus]
MEITVAVTKEKNAPFTFEQAELDGPRANEVMIKITACGICHTDLAARDQIYPAPLPIVLGHEGSGVVEAVGNEVTKVKPGDHVVISYGHCGKCPNCLKGSPSYCYNFVGLNFGGGRADGSHAHHQKNDGLNDFFFQQSSFGTYTIAPEINVVKVDPTVPLELLGPLGCGIQTGAGSVINALKPGPGSSILIFGTGAVGLSAIMAAAATGCTTIIAVDINAGRLELALKLGATHTLDSRQSDFADAIKAIDSDGIDYALDTTGRNEVINLALYALKSRGVCGIIGASHTAVSFDANYMVGKGLTIKGIVEGESIPEIFIPQLVALHKAGKFPFDQLIKFYDPAEMNQAAEDSEKGVTIKPVIRFDQLTII